ncbi:hypothetical protein Poli38472_008378 [Pythium oligandrum]|uniref:Protein kinase domain-containing protein n=1 Tax=Pythium oligandrum TaxID=41045 RepID=A0A8K1CLB3_PYTOL|nr:hypothetical protein Poli38472_008378 [Pythium oligandrum]|eukprot:TMW65736.1 hypothetical protein Poli38472_008378 [Pythium oligandrum]
MGTARWPMGFAVATVAMAATAGAMGPTNARAEGKYSAITPFRHEPAFRSTKDKWPLVITPDAQRQLPVYRDFGALYNVGSVIGRGGFGLVHLGRDNASNAPVAIKRVCKKTTSKEKFLQEVEILRTMGGSHNVVELCDAFETDDAYVLVTELVDGQELFDHLMDNGVFTENQAQSFVREVAQTLSYLHAHDVVHGDIKPENILLSASSSSIRLIDFGQSFRANDRSERQRSVGSGVATMAYAPPEVIRGAKSATEETGRAIDMWALGVVLYIILCGYHPFDPENGVADDVLRSRILTGEMDCSSPEWLALSSEARDLIQRLLHADPATRCSAEEVLTHVWLS